MVFSLEELITKAMNVRERELKMVVIDAMTTNEMIMVRDIYPFQLLTDKLFPELGKMQRDDKIWSAASSSGREPYSIAMTALEHQYKNRAPYLVVCRYSNGYFVVDAESV